MSEEIKDKQASLKVCIKLALDALGKNYTWFASECGVAETTVRNWMAQKTIPEDKLGIIHLEFPGIDDMARVLDSFAESIVSYQAELINRVEDLKKYAKLIEWSEEDKAFVGYIGMEACCHGTTEEEVDKKLNECAWNMIAFSMQEEKEKQEKEKKQAAADMARTILQALLK